MNKKIETIKWLMEKIFYSAYRKNISALQRSLRFKKLKKINAELGTNFWVVYERIGESLSYRLIKITAGKNGPTIVQIKKRGYEIIKKNLMFLNINKENEKEEDKKNDYFYENRFLEICMGEPDIWEATYGTPCPYERYKR